MIHTWILGSQQGSEHKYKGLIFKSVFAMHLKIKRNFITLKYARHYIV